MPTQLPSDYSEQAFVEEFGGIYEHADWVAKAVYPEIAKKSITTVKALRQAMHDVVANASSEQQLALIKIHPDLAGKAARANALTASSTEEQASAGLDQLSEAEYAEFTELNNRYVSKFGFPFIKAIRKSNKAEILAAFAERLPNDLATEFNQALHEIHRIAAFRLEAKFPDSDVDTNYLLN